MQTLFAGRKSTRTYAGLITAAVIIGFVAVGNIQQQQLAKAARIKALVNQSADLGKRASMFRANLREIRGRRSRTFVEFRQNCFDLQKLLDDSQASFDAQAKLRTRLAGEFPSDRKMRDMLELEDKLASLDTDLLACLRREIAVSGEILQQPPSRQRDYYREQIPPLEAKIRDLAAKEGMAIDGIKRLGFVLPADLQSTRGKGN